MCIRDRRSVPLFGNFVEHHLEFSRLSTRVLPYSRHYSETFAFSKFLCPLSHGPHLRLAFFGVEHKETHWVYLVEIKRHICQMRIPSLFRWECRHLATVPWRRKPTHSTFVYGVISLISPFGDYGTFDDLLALIRLTLSSAIDPLRLRVSSLSCPAYAKLVTYYQRGRGQ